MGLTDWLQTAKNITNYQQNEKKIPTVDRKEINRQPTWYFIFVFYFPVLSKVFCLICFQHRKGLLVSFISD